MRVNPLFASLVRPRSRSIWTPPSMHWSDPPMTLTQTSGVYDHVGLQIDYTGTRGDNYGAVVNTGAGTAVHRWYNCYIRSRAHIVRNLAECGHEFYNCYLECLNPDSDGVAQGRWLRGLCNHLIAENNTTVHVGGINIVLSTMDYMRVRYNRALNILGLVSNGSGLSGLAGYRTVVDTYDDPGTFQRQSFLQLNQTWAQAGGAGAGTGGTSRSEIAWNYIYNEPGNSCSTDILSFFGGGGVSGNHLWNHHNYIDGVWHPDITMYNAGRGIQHELGGSSRAAYIDHEDNTFVRIQGAMEINTSGDHINFTRNKVYASGKVGGVSVRPSYRYGGGSGTPSNPPPFAVPSANDGTYQVWTDNEFYFATLGYTAPGDFIDNAGNTGNSSSGWVEGARSVPRRWRTRKRRSGYRPSPRPIRPRRSALRCP